MAVPHGEHNQKTNAESTNKKTGTKNAESTDENAEAPNWHLLLLDRLDGRCCFALAFHEDHSNVFLRRFTLPFPGRRQSLRHGSFARCLRREFAEQKNHATHILSTTVCLAPLHSAPCCSQKPHENPKTEETKHKNTHAKCALHMLSVPPSCFESGPAPCRETTGCSRKFACMSLSQARVSQKIKRNMQESLAKHCNENSAASRHLFCYLSASGPKNQWSIWPQKETDVKVQFKGFELCLAATDRSLEIPHGHA